MGGNVAGSSVPFPLPDVLRRRLAAYERRLRGVETLAASSVAVACALGAFLLQFLSDRGWDTPVAIRLALAAIGVGGVLAAGIAWLRRWWWNRPDHRHLARMVQRRLPALGDRLLGAVELAEGSAPVGSEALRRAAVEQVAREMRSVDFRAAVPVRPARRAAESAAVLAALAALAAWRFPDAARNALDRWLRPAAPIPRYTFVRLSDLPPELVVAHGEPFEIECAASATAGWQPERATCRVGRARWTRPLGPQGRARFRIPGQTQPAALTLRIGDAVRSTRLRPEYRPALLSLTAAVSPPPWLPGPLRETAVEAGWLRVVEQSSVSLEGRVSRDLTSALLHAPGPRPLETTGAVFRTPAFVADRAASNGLPEAMTLTWRDVYGFEPAEPVRLRVEIVPDAPPTLRVEGLQGSVALLEEETLTFEAVASDDHGVRRLWVVWRRVEDAGGEAAPLTKTLAEGGPNQAELRAPYTISAEGLRLPPDSSADLWLAAVDHRPGREPVVSPAYRIHILSRTRHAQLLEEMARAIQARIEELRREEETRLERSTELAGAADRALEAERASEQIGESEQGERRDASAAERLARDAERLAREAVRNRDVPESTVLEWSRLAERLERLSAGPMAEAARRLGQARRVTSAAERRPLVAEAGERQREAVREMGGMLRDSAAAADELASRAFVQRLRDVARRQEEINERLRADAPRLAGLPAGRLAPADRDVLERLAGAQQRNRRQAQYIRDDLVGFAQRSGREIYAEIARDMSAPDVLEAMSAVRGHLTGNLTFLSMESSAELAARFQEWADRLEPHAGGGGSGAGGGGGAPPLPAEVLLGLLRARARQEALRESTRHLDEQRTELADYAAAARRLAARQDDIEGDLRRLNDAAPGQIRAWMEAIEQDMLVSSATLREPQTDAEAIAIQTGIIEAIAEALEGGQRESSGETAPSAEAMAALTRLMRMLNQSGGGSLAGGTTSRPNAPPAGPGVGAASGRRAPGRGGGEETLAAPAEFHDLLEGYFDGLEQYR